MQHFHTLDQRNLQGYISHVSLFSFTSSVHDQKADQRIQRKDFPGIHLDVSRENLSFEFFDLPFDR